MTASLVFEAEGVAHEIELDTRQAPQTLAKLLDTLPATIDIHCAKVAGSHIMWPVPFLQRVETASDVLSMPPGAFFYWPERQYLEITYDALQAETAAVSYLGQLKGDVAWLRDYAERQRRQQGRTLFTARLSQPGAAPAASEPPGNGASAWDRLRAARLAAWEAPPTDVAALLGRRGLNFPFGPLAIAEGELRKLHELLWRLWNDGPVRDQASIARFLIEAAISRVAGFCHMTETGQALADGSVCLSERPVDDVLSELILYSGRMAAWLDLHISWWPINELTLDTLGR